MDRMIDGEKLVKINQVCKLSKKKYFQSCHCPVWAKFAFEFPQPLHSSFF